MSFGAYEASIKLKKIHFASVECDLNGKKN